MFCFLNTLNIATRNIPVVYLWEWYCNIKAYSQGLIIEQEILHLQLICSLIHLTDLRTWKITISQNDSKYFHFLWLVSIHIYIQIKCWSYITKINSANPKKSQNMVREYSTFEMPFIICSIQLISSNLLSIKSDWSLGMACMLCDLCWLAETCCRAQETARVGSSRREQKPKQVHGTGIKCPVTARKDIGRCVCVCVASERPRMGNHYASGRLSWASIEHDVPVCLIVFLFPIWRNPMYFHHGATIYLFKVCCRFIIAIMPADTS